MARGRGDRPATPSPAEMHRSWLELVDSEGPFLAVPPLKRVWPNGIPDFRAVNPERIQVLLDARKDFEQAWERLDKLPEDEEALANYRDVRDVWVRSVLHDVIGWQASLTWEDSSKIQAQSPNQAITISANAALIDQEGDTAAFVYVIDPVDSLRDTPNDGWAATPIDRLEELLRTAEVPIGIVTDGRWWGLASFQSGSMPASGVVDAFTWIEEPRTRDAFFTILGRQYLIGGDLNDRLPVLFQESIAAAEEITEALGVQVRSAVELLVQAFSEASAEAQRRGTPDPLPERARDVYEAAVTVMMRVVFLLFAEERGLLPSGELFERSYGLVGRLEALIRREADEGEEALDATSMAWHRLLATSQAIYGGATFENLRMPAYGGSLFDPARFPWMSKINDDGTLAVVVSDRVMLHVLRSVQFAKLAGGEARQISFRDIDVEQIGYIYEGLLGYTTTRVDEAYVGLKGTAGAEPEISLATLEELRQENADPKAFAGALRDWVAEDQPAAKAQSAAAIAKGLTAEIDPGEVSALSQAVGGDTDLRDRMKPFLGITRQDLRSHPFVVMPGGLLVEETPSRKNTGAHYTPKSLAEEVVLHALQPLCYSPGPHQTGNEADWKLRPSEEILDLKVADIACGSGAFLVASARYLADRVVEAWLAEEPANAERKDLHVRAIRQVVANCLYGADINDMAVEMAKLSLWLVSLDRDLPFSFVDDKIFLGNSLLGLTSLDQLRALHIDPANASRQDVLSDVHVDVDAVIRKAIELRERLSTEIDEDDPMRSTTAKRRQYEQFQGVTAELRMLADGVIAAGLALGGKPSKALDEAYQNLRLAVKQAQPVDAGGDGDASWLESIIAEGLTPTVETDYARWRPLHWVLEAPDVMIDHGGLDAVVGNPPFLSGYKVSAANGSDVREWLVNALARGARGSADLSGYFVLRAWDLLRRSTGLFGLITTNTIAQGDTREVVLEQLVSEGAAITRAIRSAPWPTSSASVEFSAIWATVAAVGESIHRICDGQSVVGISSLLEPIEQPSVTPCRLAENEGLSFKGVEIAGEGFVIEPSDAGVVLARDPSYASVLMPYPDGKRDINGAPTQSASRWVINFHNWSEEECQRFPWAYEIVQREVLPWRRRLKPNGSFVLPNTQVEKWWVYATRRPNMVAAIDGLERVILLVQTSSTLKPVMYELPAVFTQKLVVFASDAPSLFGILSSEIHAVWAMQRGSTMRTDFVYTPSDVFETFPRPIETAEVAELGASFASLCAEVMVRRDVGLTKLFSLIFDPRVDSDVDQDVGRVRDAQARLDQSLLDAYGWGDIALSHGHYEYRQMMRWTLSPGARTEILERLLEENQRRADLESASIEQGVGRRRTSAKAVQREGLF